MEKQNYLKVLEKILSSHTFKNSPTSSNLLQYLVESTRNNIDIKESTIGIELLGKKYSGKNNDARIRVNIYHLRKKLEIYYESEGKNDEWLIVIPKGQYQVIFEKKKLKTNLQKQNFLKYSSILNILFLIIILSLTISKFHKPDLPVWSSLLHNGKPTLLYLGDSYGVMGKTATGKHGWNRDYTINNSADLYAFLDRNPDLRDSLTPADYTYITGMAASSVKNLSRLYFDQKKDFSLRFISFFDINEMKEGNAIYVGPLKNNNPFIGFFNLQNEHFKIKDSYLHYKNEIEQKDTIINLSLRGLHYEYAIVSKINGPNGTEQMLFFSDHDIGVKATIEYFTNQDSVKLFADKYLKEKETFTAVYLVNGEKRTNLELNLFLVD